MNSKNTSNCLKSNISYILLIENEKQINYTSLIHLEKIKVKILAHCFE